MKNMSTLLRKSACCPMHIAAFSLLQNGLTKESIQDRLFISEAVFEDLKNWGYTISEEISPFGKEFEEVWKLYPKKVAKKTAYRAYVARRRLGVPFDSLMKATVRYAKVCESGDSKYIKHGSTFFGPDDIWKDFLAEKEQSDKAQISYTCPMCEIDFPVDEVLKQHTVCPSCGKTIEFLSLPLEVRSRIYDK